MLLGLVLWILGLGKCRLECSGLKTQASGFRRIVMWGAFVDE